MPLRAPLLAPSPGSPRQEPDVLLVEERRHLGRPDLKPDLETQMRPRGSVGRSSASISGGRSMGKGGEAAGMRATVNFSGKGWPGHVEEGHKILFKCCIMISRI